MCLCIDAWKICVNKKNNEVKSPSGSSFPEVGWKENFRVCVQPRNQHWSAELEGYSLFRSTKQLQAAPCTKSSRFTTCLQAPGYLGDLRNERFWCVWRSGRKVVFATQRMCALWDLLYPSVKGPCINPHTPIASDICLKTQISTSKGKF